MTKILMVCLGNICRSPLAQGILENKLPRNKFLVDSAGTSNFHIGCPPDSRAIQIAINHHINISSYKGRQLQPSDFEKFDLIYVMDKNNYSEASKLAPSHNYLNKLKHITSEIPSKKISTIPDPYYGDIFDFEEVYKLLDEACENISKKMCYE